MSVNAGIAELRLVEQWDEAAFDRSFATNVKDPISSSRRYCRFWRIQRPSYPTRP
jgi:hypothetical protein